MRKPDYEAAGVRLYCGDCLEILPELEFECMITDPPYGISHSSSKGASWQDTTIAGDSDTGTRDKAIGDFPEVAAFGTWKTPPIEGTKGTLVWDKGPASGMGDLAFPWKASWELIYIRGRAWAGHRGEGILRGHTVLTWESKGRCHPHQKPVSLLEQLVRKSTAKVICDPFMGSGSTALACMRLGREFIGCEIDEQHFATAVRRIEAELNRHPLFEKPSGAVECQ